MGDGLESRGGACDNPGGFVLASAQDAARRTIEEHARIELSVDDSLAFAEALLNPEPFSEHLRETARRYRRATGI